MKWEGTRGVSLLVGEMSSEQQDPGIVGRWQLTSGACDMVRTEDQWLGGAGVDGRVGRAM